MIVAASILTAYDAPMLPISSKSGAPPGREKHGVKLFRAIGGLPIIRMLMEAKPSRLLQGLGSSCTTTSVWIGSLSYDDTLENLLRIFELTRLRRCKSRAPRTPPPALITLDEVVSLYRDGS